jgi:hypothetical protein
MLGVDEIIKRELSRIQVPIPMQGSVELIASQAQGFHGKNKIPTLGSVTPWEKILLKWVNQQSQQQALKIELAAVVLTDKMCDELGIDEQDSKEALSCTLRAISGDYCGQRRFLSWLARHPEDLEALYSASCSWSENVCSILRCNILLCSRLEFRDWTPDLLSNLGLMDEVLEVLDADLHCRQLAHDEESVEIKKP